MPDEEEYKTVLGVFKERRRPIQFKYSTNQVKKKEYENLLRAMF